MQSQKALEAIGKSLQTQYERWQPRAKYKVSLDPTLEDVKKLCVSYRRSAKSERILFHYNGHGVPKPTVNGEVWVFNKSYTQYIPLSVYDLQTWLGKPSIYVIDCSNAGMLMNAFQDFATQRYQESEGVPMMMTRPPGSQPPVQSAELRRAMQDIILLGACGTNETLPQNATLPADLFTSCLTTPIKIALRWFCGRSLLKHEGLNLDIIDRIPGKQTDRKTLLGELNWIFTAITDTIAWNILPRPLFQKLFRQDLLVASLFRNFLLAERIMRAFGCTPMSYPELPPTHQHPMWHAWDLAAETCLAQLPGLLSGDPNIEYRPSSFFTEQLTAFEVWLEHGSRDKPPPEQLPIVLQVLLSQSHRLRALVLLGRFLDMGTWAVELALSVGIFPYVLKLLQTTANELRQILVFIWTKILALDQSCKNDLTKDSSFVYFIRFLEMPDAHVPAESKAGAAFILSVICNGHPKGQKACLAAKLIEVCIGVLQAQPTNLVSRSSTLLAQWTCVCLGKLHENSFEISNAAFDHGICEHMTFMLGSASSRIRASAAFALGTLISLIKDVATFEENREELSEQIRNPKRMASEREVAEILLSHGNDSSSLVRREIICALGKFAYAHTVFIDIAYQARESSYVVFSTIHRRSPSGLSDSFTGQLSFDGKEASLKENGSQKKSNSYPEKGTLSKIKDESNPGSSQKNAEELPITSSQLYQNVLDALLEACFDPSPKVAVAARASLKACSFEIVATKRRPTEAIQQGGNFSFSPQRKHNFRGKKLNLSMSLSSERLSSMIPSPGSHHTFLGGSPGLTTPRRTKPDVSRSSSYDFGETFNLLKISTEQKDHIQCRINSQTLPTPEIFVTGCKYFASPLLSSSNGTNEPRSASWSEPVDPIVVWDRHQRIEENFTHSRSVRPHGLDHQLAVIDTSSEYITALVFDPLDDYLSLGDSKGFITTRKMKDGQLNRFNVSQNRDIKSKSLFQNISYLSILCPDYNPLLLTATTEGRIAVFRNYTQRASQQQATSWIAIPKAQQASSYPSVIESNNASQILYASGFSAPKNIFIWDMLRELCIEEVTNITHNISCMCSASEGQPFLLTGCENGSVSCFDLRDPHHHVVRSESYDKGIIGVTFVNNDTQIVAGYTNGIVRLFDIRAGNVGVVKDVEGHDSIRSKMTAFTGHKCGTMFATSSAHTIKIWNKECELLSVAKPHGNFLPRSGSSIRTLAFHPTKHIIAAGGIDSISSIYCCYG